MADDADAGGVTGPDVPDDDPVKAARARAERARRAADAAAKAASAAEEAALEAERAFTDDDPDAGESSTAATKADDLELSGPGQGTTDVSAVVDLDKKPTEDESVESDPVDHEPVGASKPSRAVLIVGAVAAMLLIAGVVVNVLLYLDHRDHTDAQDRRDRYVEVAKQTVINMTSLDHEHAQRDVDRVLASATGEFRTDFEKRGAAFTEVIQKSKVATKGQVALAGVEKENSNGSLVVMIASNSQVSNAAGAQNEDRAWRLRVTVVDVDGIPKVSKVEFVP